MLINTVNSHSFLRAKNNEDNESEKTKCKHIESCYIRCNKCEVVSLLNITCNMMAPIANKTPKRYTRKKKSRLKQDISQRKQNMSIPLNNLKLHVINKEKTMITTQIDNWIYISQRQKCNKVNIMKQFET